MCCCDLALLALEEFRVVLYLKFFNNLLYFFRVLIILIFSAYCQYLTHTRSDSTSIDASAAKSLVQEYVNYPALSGRASCFIHSPAGYVLQALRAVPALKLDAYELVSLPRLNSNIHYKRFYLSSTQFISTVSGGVCLRGRR